MQFTTEELAYLIEVVDFMDDVEETNYRAGGGHDEYVKNTALIQSILAKLKQ